MKDTNPLGNIFISHRAIATIAHQAALASYGVVGLSAKSLAEGITSALVKEPMKGVEVALHPDGIAIDLYIVVEYGTRIAIVALALQTQSAIKSKKLLDYLLRM